MSYYDAYNTQDAYGGGGGGGGYNNSHSHSHSYPPPPPSAAHKELSPDTIYVSGLGSEVTEELLADKFGSVGIIKMDKKTKGKKIWVYRDKATGLPKGDATSKMQ